MASDSSKLEKLIEQCKANDVDVKVDALTKLQAEFESGVEINDPDGLINVLKTCLRASNQHLTTATLTTLPPLLPLLISRSLNYAQPLTNQSRSASSSTSSVAPSSLVDAATLRQVLNAFLPAGGVIERLGDKEKAQNKARETLIILGGLAFRTGGSSTMSSKSRDKGPETPIMIFERFMREGGLASKVWKVREQCILTLVHIRRAHHQFPIRPYLSLLVDCLEDTDAHVRECARQSVVELFSGPGVSDGARADLKKEMSKKNVRKTIVDGVLSKLLSGSVSGTQSQEGSENGDASSKPKEYIPPSLALQGRKPTVGTQGVGVSRTVSQGSIKDMPPRPASRAALVPSVPPTPTSENIEIQPVYITSSRDLENEFAAMAKPFEGKETEFNWAAREQAILRVRGMLKGDVHLRYLDAFLACLKDGFIQWSLKTLASLRTTVSANTASLYSEMALALGTLLDPFCDTLVSNLLKMAGFTKKIAAQQSQASVTAIITNSSAQPRLFLPLFWLTLQEKTVQARAFVVAHLKTYLEVHGTRSRNLIETSGSLETLEKSLKKALGDPNPAVRETARALFWVFESVWADRGLSILETLDPTARKQVEKVCPRPELISALPPTTPKNANKKSSVAAAIAASRAKAKAIATAPPTLRHQATAASHTLPQKRAGSPSTSPRSSTVRPASPLRMSTSPPSPPRARVTSTTMSRSVSATGPPTSHRRTPSGGSGRETSPPSPSEQLSNRRRTSSPLAKTGPSTSRSSVIRQAIQTALPASPPSSSGEISPTPRPNGSTRNTAVPLPRHSTLLSQIMNGEEDSLLLAQAVPIPDDSDSDEHSINLISFSTPFEMYPPVSASQSKSKSAAHSLSPKSNDSKPTGAVSNTMSSDSVADMAGSQLVVEDALRARAEQAESAAERLLELVEPDVDGMHHSTIPASLLVGSSNGHVVLKPKPKPTPAPIMPVRQVPPVTPINRNAAVMKRAAMFQDSPVRGGQASLMDVLQDRKHETGWWLKRKNLVAQRLPVKAGEQTARVQQLNGYIAAVVQGSPGIDVLRELALLCVENPVTESPSPPPSPGYGLPNSPTPFTVPSRSLPSLHADMWDKDKTFERLFNALITFLEPYKTEEEIEYGLIVLWEMLENQGPYIEGREADIFSTLLRVRYCNKLNVLEATNTIRDALTLNIEPVYGLTTMHASLRTFHTEAPPTSLEDDLKSATYAFGLVALGKFILRLPAEIAEEELPRLKDTLISSLNDKTSLIVRESAAASITAAQLVLRDETHLFALLDGLADDKKNLLTYLFDKHGARGLAGSTGASSMDKLEKEIKRLDTRTSTPSRSPLTS